MRRHFFEACTPHFASFGIRPDVDLMLAWSNQLVLISPAGFGALNMPGVWQNRCTGSPKWSDAPLAPHLRAVALDATVRVGLSMEEFDLTKSFDELLNATEASKGAALNNTTEAPEPIALESISPRLPPEGQTWLNGLNRFCRRAVEHDLRSAGPDLFVEYWESLRDTLQKLERDFGPSDNWK